jgi:4,5-DOPA dioxygenase extradiol
MSMTQPVVFFGHGSPMNALGGPYAEVWREVGAGLGRPRGMVMVSAHWETQGLGVTGQTAPPTIHDFGGFPPELFAMQYPAPGSPALAPLRDEGVIIAGSGDWVHNLRAWKRDGGGPYPWATAFDEAVKAALVAGDHAALIDWVHLAEDAQLSVPTDEHYLPLLYVVAQQRPGEPVAFFNDTIEGGSISMSGVRIG